MALNLQDYGQSALSLLAIALYAYNYIKKARESQREIDRLKKIGEDQYLTEKTTDARQLAADARSVSMMRAEVIEEQSRRITRLEGKAKLAEDERDECREDLALLRGRVKELEDRK